MDAVNAFPLSDIDGVQISDDGLQMLLHAKDGSARPVVLAFRNDQLTNLMVLTAIAQRRSERVRKLEPKARAVFEANGCELAPGAAPGETILSIALEGEGRFGFRLGDAQLRGVYDALHAKFGGA